MATKDFYVKLANARLVIGTTVALTQPSAKVL
jgi:hypothetical protein